jgi:hypothetical protein
MGNSKKTERFCIVIAMLSLLNVSTGIIHGRMINLKRYIPLDVTEFITFSDAMQ